jgi:hypothetical protein
VSNSLLQHANGENAWIGIDGNTGEITDMKERKVNIVVSGPVAMIN